MPSVRPIVVEWLTMFVARVHGGTQAITNSHACVVQVTEPKSRLVVTLLLQE